MTTTTTHHAAGHTRSDGSSWRATATCSSASGSRMPWDSGRRDEESPILKEAATQLEEYFAGERTEFDLRMELDGTPFQKDVWAELTRIPYGETISYGELARRVGRPKGPRAVGQANGRNPIAIIVPCHRVLASNGIGGYGGGLTCKRVAARAGGRLGV